MNPNSVVARILQDGKTVQVPYDDDHNRSSDNDNDIRNMRELSLERAFGNFWMMQDLRKNGNEPMLTSKISLSIRFFSVP